MGLSPNSTRTAPHIMTLVVLTGMSAMSMNVFLPSLPGMAQEFGVDYAVMQLSVSGYIAVSAVMQLLIGPISDKLGRRPIVLASLAIFILATIGTILAQDATTFLIFRMIQALVTACQLVPRAVIRDLYDGNKAASMLGYVTMGMAVVPMTAPIFGGILDQTVGWRGSFVLMGVTGGLAMLLAWRDMGETIRGGGIPLRQQIANYPVLFRSIRFWGYCLTATMTTGCFFGFLGGVPFVGQYVYNLTPAQVGYFFAAPSIGYMLGNYISARFSVKIGLNRMILFGALVGFIPLTLALLAEISGNSSLALFFGAIAIMGIGNGLTIPNANAGIMSVRPELAGTASGLGGAMTIAGGSVMAALAAALLTPETGATPLLAIMTASSLGALLAILWVQRREAQIRRVG